MSTSALSRAPRPSSLADVLDLILDKGLVIDAYVRISVVGIEVLTIDARIVIASVDTYLHFAEAVNRLDLGKTEMKGLTGLFGSDDEDDDDEGDHGRQAPGVGRRHNGRSALAGGTNEDEELDSDRDGGRRVPAALARKVASRGRWEDDK